MDKFVDMQVNGYGGVSFSSRGLTVEMIGQVTEALKAGGTDIFCPTVITTDDDAYNSNLPVLARAMADPALGRHIAGIHIEGPFLADESAGAHPRSLLRKPDTDLFKRWQELADGNIRILTLAPELPGAQPLIREAAGAGVIVALGHHMAPPESIRQAAENGAALCTHLGNGIPNTLPRHPNPLWTQLASDRLSASFITDGHHLPPEFIRVAWRVKTVDRFILTSDSASVAGCKPGIYGRGEKRVRVDDDGKICLPSDTSVLAGSSALMKDCVDYIKTCIDLSREEIEKISRTNALKLLGNIQ